MNHLLNGVRAGVLTAFVLTLWSFMSVSSSMGDAADSVGVLYVASAYGLLGLPQLIYGLVLGCIVAGWQMVVGPHPREHFAESGRDQTVASWLLTAPIMVLVVGAGVGGTHFFVTSTFVRATFQPPGTSVIPLLLTIFMIRSLADSVDVITPFLLPMFAGIATLLQYGLLMLTLTLLENYSIDALRITEQFILPAGVYNVVFIWPTYIILRRIQKRLPEPQSGY